MKVVRYLQIGHVGQSEPGHDAQSDNREGVDGQVSSIVSHSPFITNFLCITLSRCTTLWTNKSSGLFFEVLSIAIDVFVVHIAAIRTNL